MGFKRDLSKSVQADKMTIAILQMEGELPPRIKESDNQHKGDYKNKDTGEYIECKTDYKSIETGNAGWEIWSNYGLKMGWGHPDNTLYEYEQMACHFPGERAIALFPFKEVAHLISQKAGCWRELKQKKTKQKNDSRVLIIPLPDLFHWIKKAGGSIIYYDVPSMSQGHQRAWSKLTGIEL